MKSPIKKYLIFLLINCCLSASTSQAVEITPLLGYRGGGEFYDTSIEKKHDVSSSNIFGLILGWPYKKNKMLEVYYSHQSSELQSVNVTIPSVASTTNIDLTIDYLHIGGTTPITNDSGLDTYASGGLGVTYLSPDLTGLQSDLRASFSVGAGMKWPIAKNIALRMEARALATLFNSNSTLFCNGGCSLTVNGSLFWQAEVFSGLAIKF